MLDEPLSLTDHDLSSTPLEFAAISRGENGSTYRHALPSGEVYDVVISHQPKATRVRSAIRLTYTSIVPDPLRPANSMPVSMSTFLVIDRPVLGLSNDKVSSLTDMLIAWLNAGSGANGNRVLRVIGGES